MKNQKVLAFFTMLFVVGGCSISPNGDNNQDSSNGNNSESSTEAIKEFATRFNSKGYVSTYEPAAGKSLTITDDGILKVNDDSVTYLSMAILNGAKVFYVDGDKAIVYSSQDLNGTILRVNQGITMNGDILVGHNGINDYRSEAESIDWPNADPITVKNFYDKIYDINNIDWTVNPEFEFGKVNP